MCPAGTQPNANSSGCVPCQSTSIACICVVNFMIEGEVSGGLECTTCDSDFYPDFGDQLLVFLYLIRVATNRCVPKTPCASAVYRSFTTPCKGGTKTRYYVPTGKMFLWRRLTRSVPCLGEYTKQNETNIPCSCENGEVEVDGECQPCPPGSCSH